MGPGAFSAYYKLQLQLISHLSESLGLNNTCAPQGCHAWSMELPQDGTTRASVRFALSVCVTGPTETLLRKWNTWASQLLDSRINSTASPGPYADCHQKQGVPCTEGASAVCRSVGAAEPTRTRRRLLDLYHGSKAASLCQQDAFTQGGQVRQAGARDPIRHLVVLFQAPVGF